MQKKSLEPQPAQTGRMQPLVRAKKAREQLAKVKHGKKKRIKSSARLQYLQTCLMRLELVLATFVG